MTDFIEELKTETKYHEEILDYIDRVTADNIADSEYLYDGKLEMSCQIEKIHALQKAYYFNFAIVDYAKDYDKEICFSVASGIDCNDIIDYSFDGVNAINVQATQRVLTDITLDIKRVADFLGKEVEDIGKPQLKKIKLVFDYNKKEIIDTYTNQSYDDYMTGGGTIKTDKHYKDFFDKMHRRGLFWDCVYENIEVERNIL